MWDLSVASIYITYMWEKNSKLDKGNLLESPFTEITYKVRGCMAFRSNELGLVWSWHSLSKRGHIGHACGPWDGKELHEGRFLFLQWKVCFLFLECRNQGFFCEAATKTAYGKLGTTPHINNRPPGIHISALVSSRKLSELFFKFYTNSCLFRWNRGGFAL
jgi:hypothetical protein